MPSFLGRRILVLYICLRTWGCPVLKKTVAGKQIWSHGLYLLQEFEVIAQIKLLQSACNNYSFTREDQFVDWFHSLERLSEAER